MHSSAAGRRRQFFLLIFTKPGRSLLVVPCTRTPWATFSIFPVVWGARSCETSLACHGLSSLCILYLSRLSKEGFAWDVGRTCTVWQEYEEESRRLRWMQGEHNAWIWMRSGGNIESERISQFCAFPCHNHSTSGTALWSISFFIVVTGGGCVLLCHYAVQISRVR